MLHIIINCICVYLIIHLLCALFLINAADMVNYKLDKVSLVIIYTMAFQIVLTFIIITIIKGGKNDFSNRL